MNGYKLAPFPASFKPDGAMTITDGTVLSSDTIYYIFDGRLEDTFTDEYAIVQAALNTAQQLATYGCEGIRLSIISPFGPAPTCSVLRQTRLHTLIAAVRELCPGCLIGCAIRKKQPEGKLVSASDFLLLDYRQTRTTKEALEKLLIVKSTPEYYPAKPEIFACGPFTGCEEDMLERLEENGARILFTDEGDETEENP